MNFIFNSFILKIFIKNYLFATSFSSVILAYKEKLGILDVSFYLYLKFLETYLITCTQVNSFFEYKEIIISNY